MLRKFKNYSNRGSKYSFEKYSFTVSDNEPALWVFMETFNQFELDFSELIENQRFPIAFAIKEEAQDMLREQKQKLVNWCWKGIK